VFFLPQVYNPCLIIRETSDKSNLRDILTSTNHDKQGQEESKQTWQLNVTWVLYEILEQEKDIK
jgi:hypothetical protein